MHVGGCLLVITIAASSLTIVIAENVSSNARSKRHILPLLGFLEGYKIGQNLALRLPPFVLSPIFIVPSINQQQSVNIHRNKEDSIGESGTIQVISPAKLVSQPFHHNENSGTDELKENSVDSELIDENNDIENDTFRQNVLGINDTNIDDNKEEIDPNLTTSTENTVTTETSNLDLNITTIENGPYPTAVYKNELVNTITLTETPIDKTFVLPASENNWQNFSSQNNTDKEKNSADKIESRIYNTWSNAITYMKEPSHYYNYNKYPYSASYNNADNIYISNSYRPPYSNNDRWHTYSTPVKYESTSQFRPLAGLYYDGFLQQSPVKQTGFVPYNNNYYY